MSPVMQSAFLPRPHCTNTQTRVCAMSQHPALSPSDGLRDRDRAERRAGGLERSGPLLLSRGGSGGHRGVPAGALARSPARTHAGVTSKRRGATDTYTLAPGHQDHRLV